MTWIVITVICVLLAVVLWKGAPAVGGWQLPTGALRHRGAATSRIDAEVAQSSGHASGRRGMGGRLGALIVGVVWLLITVLMSVHPVKSGDVGVVSRFGQIVGQRSEGLAVIAPWETMQTVSIRTQRATFDQLSAASSETQDVFLRVSVNYSVSANAVQNLIRNVGTNWFDVLLVPRVTNFVKEVTATYRATDIVPGREEIRRAVRDRLAVDLDQYSITINDLLIDNIDFQPDFKAAIEQKQIATENARQERERIAIEEARAEQVRATARGDADARRINAEADADVIKVRAAADADAITITAVATAEANRQIADSLTPEVLQYQAITELGDNVTIAMIPSGQGVIIDPSTLFNITPPVDTDG